jgi:hemolysin III
MGWLILVALDPLLEVLPTAGFHWLLAGGVLYTLGIIFFLLDQRYPWAHAVWHLFVLGGSSCQYVAILLYT